MTELEKIAMRELEIILLRAIDRVHEDNHARIQHERIFIQSDLKKAIDVCRALYPIDQRK